MKSDPTRARIVELVPDIERGSYEGKCVCSHSFRCHAQHNVTAKEIENRKSEMYKPACTHCVCSMWHEILGRPITLADVLRAIKQSPKCDTYWEYEVISDLIWGRSMHGEHIWNLALDYDSQTQEVKDFIGKLISTL